ncbi:Hypothetical predicted protein [Lecanosticta acicola]|uniref:Uncharacterized protein n=1 Tax=Lecanosticta acicola TaxID=111012 RepID=A0AAI8W1J0_9PEZI|nr:Hypothetical predicted protein [Lecanosticta acicola]
MAMTAACRAGLCQMVAPIQSPLEFLLDTLMAEFAEWRSEGKFEVIFRILFFADPTLSSMAETRRLALAHIHRRRTEIRNYKPLPLPCKLPTPTITTPLPLKAYQARIKTLHSQISHKLEEIIAAEDMFDMDGVSQWLAESKQRHRLSLPVVRAFVANRILRHQESLQDYLAFFPQKQGHIPSRFSMTARLYVQDHVSPGNFAFPPSLVPLLRISDPSYVRHAQLWLQGGPLESRSQDAATRRLYVTNLLCRRLLEEQNPVSSWSAEEGHRPAIPLLEVIPVPRSGIPALLAETQTWVKESALERAMRLMAFDYEGYRAENRFLIREEEEDEEEEEEERGDGAEDAGSGEIEAEGQGSNCADLREGDVEMHEAGAEEDGIILPAGWWEG